MPSAGFLNRKFLLLVLGMHRFVWNLTWGLPKNRNRRRVATCGCPIRRKFRLERISFVLQSMENPKTQPLQVVMDPRSSATGEGLAQQFETGRQIYAEAMVAYRTLVELKSVQKQLADLQLKSASHEGDAKSRIAEAKAAVDKIITDRAHTVQPGLQDAYRNITAALRVVEGGDRPAPSQALTVYQESSEQINARTAEWTVFKQTTLQALNEQLQQAGLPVITVPRE